MSALTLDLRGPIIALVGDFNPAIFSMNWIATHLFGVPQGAEMELLEAVIQVDTAAYIRLSFLKGVAINVTANRIDFHAADGNPETFTRLESVASKLIETLPHTPVRALGCNFRWADEDAPARVIDLFDTPEGIEGRFAVTTRQSSSQVQLEDCILNLGRVSVGTEVQFTFNYHQAVSSADECRRALDGIILKYLENSTEIMRTLYGYEDHSVLEYSPAEKMGASSDAA